MDSEGRRNDLLTRVPIAFPDELYEWLRTAAFRRHISMAELVRVALREYRLQHEPQLPLPLGGRELKP